jgi:hypothetical protein
MPTRSQRKPLPSLKGKKARQCLAFFYGCELNVEHYKGTAFKTRQAWTEEQSVPPPGKNAGSVFEQRSALARLRAYLMDEVRIRAGRASMDAIDFAIGPCLPRQHLAVLRF